MSMLRALTIAFAALLVPAGSLAQEAKSLVSTRLEVTGLVSRTLSLSVDDLRAIAKRRGVAEAGGYGGILLSELLKEAAIREDERHAQRRTYVVALATDGYQAVFSWGELFNTSIGRGVLVAYERDGAPLREGEGRFALVSLADERTGPRHVKWLNRIDVRRVPE
jgi:DMSO/TMAO reductase YedYZ molybdopterin-dependent catalytic subunit